MEWLTNRLERLRNGTALEHSHLIPFSHLSNLERFFFEIKHSSHAFLKWYSQIPQSVCFLPRAFWVFAFFFFLHLKSLCGAQVGKVWRHTCIAYFAKSNNGSMEKNIIQSNQDVQVCGYIDAILILLCSLKHFSLFIETLKRPFVRTWAIFYSFLFFSFFFMSHFFFHHFLNDSLKYLFTTKLFRERSYICGAFILKEPNQYIFVHSRCRSRTFFWWILSGMYVLRLLPV